MTGVSFNVDPRQETALEVRDATFQWEELSSPKDTYGAKNVPAPLTATAKTSDPFQVRDINMSVPRGTVVAVVGRVGSGKVFLVN